MKEPQHPHFLLSDGQYCHMLEDRLVIGKRDIPDPLPKPQNKLDTVLLLLGILGLGLLLFFTVMTILTHYYMVTLTLVVLMALIFVSLLRTAGYTTTKTIFKNDILNVEYHKRAFGYDFFIIRYSGEKGKLWKRRLAIYDSQISVDQAIAVMKEQGLLK